MRYLGIELSRLLDVLAGSDVREMELQENGVRVRLHRTGDLQAAESDSNAEESEILSILEPVLHQITSPLVGTFYRASAPEMAPFVSMGSRVQDDTVVGIVEALQVLTEVEAGCSGEVIDVRLSDGQPVEYGQVLFEVRGG